MYASCTFSGNLVTIKNELPEQQTPEGNMAEGENDGDVSFMGCTVDQDKQVRKLFTADKNTKVGIHLCLCKLLSTSSSIFFFFNIFVFLQLLSHLDFSHGKFRLLSLGKASGESCAVQPTVHAGCFTFSISIIYGTLTWTTGSLTCAEMLLYVVAHEGVLIS